MRQHQAQVTEILIWISLHIMDILDKDRDICTIIRYIIPHNIFKSKMN